MWPKALLLGDSQTQLAGTEGGWVQLLADKFVRRLDILNRGFSGDKINRSRSDGPGSWQLNKITILTRPI